MRDDDETRKGSNDNPEHSGVSRRDFLKISGISVAVPLVAGPKTVMAAGQEVPVHGPGKVPMEFAINGKTFTTGVYPTVTYNGTHFGGTAVHVLLADCSKQQYTTQFMNKSSF